MKSEQIIAATLREHRQPNTSDPGGSNCICGEWMYHWPENVDHVAHQAAMVVDALAQAGFDVMPPTVHRVTVPDDEIGVEAMKVLNAHGITGEQYDRLVRSDHDFLPVNGHHDDECTHRSDGTDATYCGEPKAWHLDEIREIP